MSLSVLDLHFGIDEDLVKVNFELVQKLSSVHVKYVLRYRIECFSQFMLQLPKSFVLPPR